MPENPANQCTSCPLVTSINEKARKGLPQMSVGNFPQTTDTKGYRGVRGARSCACAGLIRLHEIYQIKRGCRIGLGSGIANSHIRSCKWRVRKGQSRVACADFQAQVMALLL